MIGKAPPPHRLDILRELNKSLHRVEIVPYDVLAERAEAVLDNVARYVLAAGGEPRESVEAESAG